MVSTIESLNWLYLLALHIPPTMKKGKRHRISKGIIHGNVGGDDRRRRTKQEIRKNRPAIEIREGYIEPIWYV